MAVIKIVPMPGAVGDKGDEGSPGPQGPQGETGLQGAPGADALWSYNGAWQANAAYAIGDLVTYQGQLYYAKAITTAGTLPTDTSKFDLIAAKGEDWVYQTSSGMWDTNIKAQSNISGGYTAGLALPSMGLYSKMANIVNFYFTYNLGDNWNGQAYPLTFDNSGESSISFKLPFPIQESFHGGPASNSYDYGKYEYAFTGRLFGRADATPGDGLFNQPDEEGWIEVHGIGFTDETDPNNRVSYVILNAQDFEDINTNNKRWKPVTHSWPFDFSGTTGHRYFQLQISGTYISA
jgi:hypothetical protein